MDAVSFNYYRVVYGSTPGEILSYPRLVDFGPLPRFYQAVLSARVAVDRGFSALADTLVVASSTVRTPVSTISTKSTYSLLLEFHSHKPACVRSFNLAGCSAHSIGPPLGLSCFGFVLTSQ